MNQKNLNTSEQSEKQQPIDTAKSPEELRRDFLKRFGGYAASAPVVTFTVFSSLSSKAIASTGSDEGG